MSPKLLGFGEACPGVLKVSCCMGFTKFGDKCVNNLDLLYYVVGVACLHREDPCRRICMHLDSRTSCLFAMLCFSSFCCIFICTNPKTNLVNVCAQLISLRNDHFFGDTFDVLCFHLYKLQSNLNSRQRRKSTVAARKKEIN